MNWDKFIKEKGFAIKENQKEYQKRTENFLLSDNKIQINPGGMGLGKTKACTFSIRNVYNKFENFYIATPISSIKDEWVKEFNIINLNNKYIVWINKDDVCIKKRKDLKFNTKNCNDDCIYRNQLNSNKLYTPKCEALLEALKFPLNINKYYKKEISNCLLPIMRLGLENRRLIIGDYFGFLNKNMYKYLVKKTTQNSCLIIDEAHNLPERALMYLSKQINLTKLTDTWDKDLTMDIVGDVTWYKLKCSFEVIKKVEKEIINKYKENKKNNRYNYVEFYNCYNKNINSSCYKLKDLVKKLDEIAKNGFSVKPYISKDDPYFYKFVHFITFWEENYQSSKYKNYFQYYNYKKYNKERIILEINNCDPSEFLSDLFNNWKKIVLLSGTIPDKEYFKTILGLDKNKLKLKFEKPLNSYSIKKDVLVYPKDNYSANYRDKSIEKNKDLLNEVLNNLNGRTLLFVLSKQMGKTISNNIINKKIINFCINNEGENINQKEFERLKGEFNKQDSCIGIINIQGRGTEGNNYTNINGKSVKNIIIYGYPFSRQGNFYEDSIKYWTDKFGGDEKAAKEYVNFRPNASKIYQACMRAKRRKEDNPIIILFGQQFSENIARKYLYDECKGKLIFNSKQLIDEIKMRNNNE